MRTFILSIVVFVSVIAIVFSIVVYIMFPIKYKDLIRAEARKNEISPVLVASIIRAESNFRKDAVSDKGAVGLMQIMPATAEYVAKIYSINEYDLFNPNDNIVLGVHYLRYLLDKFNDLKTVIIAYNAGEGNVIKWLNGAQRLETSPFPETNAYLEKVLNAMNFYRYRL